MSQESKLSRFIINQLDDKEMGCMSTESLCHLVDLTLLNKQAEQNQIDDFVNRANRLEVAAVCVYPDMLRHCRVLDGVKKACVLNFPDGQQSMTQCLFELDTALGQQVDEIDVVFPYQQWLNDQKQASMAFLKELLEIIHQHKLTSKVILETGACEDLKVLHELCLDVLDLGAQFLKSSTGTTEQGASLESALVMLSAIQTSKSDAGVKFSGGIKSFIQAREYIQLARQAMQKEVDATWFRLGASSLLDAL